MTENCKKEITELHIFFEKWLNGTIPNDDKTLARVNDALSDEFQIISPNATITDKKTLLLNLKKAYGSWTGDKIWIKNIQVRQLHIDLYLAVYEEWQGSEEKAKGRLSSALFKEEPNGKMKWLHLHEVWMK
ncbi:MAG: hypothetical protein ACFCU6_01795 [Balneolaceae bacterium]